MLFNICLFVMFLIFWTRLPLSSSVLIRNFQKTPVCVETHYPVLLDTFFYLTNIQCRKLWFSYMFMYMISFYSYQSVGIWYIGFLFFTYAVFFLHRQSIYIIGVGQEIKLAGSEIHVYVPIHWRHLKIIIWVVRSSVMLFMVHKTMSIYNKAAKEGAPHL